METYTALEDIKERGRGCKSVILTGAGGAFCAGGDIKGMANRQMTPMEQRNRMRSGHNRIYDIVHLELPVISLVDGAAGAGCNLALLADFVLATPRAFFTQAFAKIGLIPDWSGFFVLPGLLACRSRRSSSSPDGVCRRRKQKNSALCIPLSGKTPRWKKHAPLRVGSGCFNVGYRNGEDHSQRSAQSGFPTLLEMEAMGQSLVRETEFHREAVRRFKTKEAPLFDWDRN